MNPVSVNRDSPFGLRMPGLPEVQHFHPFLQPCLDHIMGLDDIEAGCVNDMEPFIPRLFKHLISGSVGCNDHSSFMDLI